MDLLRALPATEFDGKFRRLLPLVFRSHLQGTRSDVLCQPLPDRWK
jgi:hypothetical protein